MFAADLVMRRYWSCRSDYKKAKDKLKINQKLTTNQAWKLKNRGFIEPFIKDRCRTKDRPGPQSKVSICNNLQIMFTLSPSATYNVKSLICVLQPLILSFSFLDFADPLNNLSVVIAYASDHPEFGDCGGL